MTSKYNAKIQAILQNNTDYTLEEKNEIIQELLMQACIILSTPPLPPTDGEWGIKSRKLEKKSKCLKKKFAFNIFVVLKK